jgi:hypothetical protein
VISILDIAKDPDDISCDQQQQQQPHQPILLLSIDLVACYYVMVDGISNQKKRK